MSRFGAQEYLDAYASRHAYPRIHDPLFTLIVEQAAGSSFCDMGSCTGLLGQRVLDMIPGATVCGIERDADAARRGAAAGVTVPTLVAALTPATVDEVGGWIAQHVCTVLIARRCLPEIFGGDPAFAARAADILAGYGLVELFIEGRVPVRGAVNPLATIEREVALLASRYKLRTMRGACAYMTRV